MEQKKDEWIQVAAKSLTLTICGVAILLCLFPPPQWGVVFEGCPMVGRLTYSFFHANVFHALVNVWTMLAIVFLGGVGLWAVSASYVAAVCLPCGLSVPTCGLSVMAFFLLGSLSYRVRSLLRYDLPVITFIILGFVLPHVNAMAHVYAYIVGWVYGFLFTPKYGRGGC